MRLFARRLDIGPARGKGRAGILGLEPVHAALDPLDVIRPDIIAFTKRRGHVDMSDIIARCRIDAIERFEEYPMFAELLGDCGEVCGALPCEAVAQAPISVSGVGEIETGFALKDRVAARNTLSCQDAGQHT